MRIEHAKTTHQTVTSASTYRRAIVTRASTAHAHQPRALIAHCQNEHRIRIAQSSNNPLTQIDIQSNNRITNFEESSSEHRADIKRASITHRSNSQRATTDHRTRCQTTTKHRMRIKQSSNDPRHNHRMIIAHSSSKRKLIMNA